MDNLNNDCLREILLYIAVNERIELRRVCKTWCKIVDDCWRNVREVIIIDAVSKYSSSQYNKPVVDGTDDCVRIRTSGQKLIEGVMKRCGDIITTLTEYQEGKNNSGVPLAIKYCRNIEKLKTKVITKVDDKNTSQLLAVNRKLKTLQLTIMFKNAKVCFRKIPTDHLEKLDLIACDCDHPSTVILIGQKQVIGRCSSSLKELSVDYFDDELLKLIGQKITLEKLELRFIYPLGFTDSGLYRILELKKLRELVLEGTPPVAAQRGFRVYLPPVADDFLMALVENLPLLEVIDIQHPRGMTNKGFKSLASLKKLRKLTMITCPEITDEFLVFFSGLEELDLMNCPIRDEGGIKLLEKANTMRVLGLEDSFITNKTLVAAVDATKRRDNGICLTIYNTGTDTDRDTLAESSPLLKIVNNDDSW